MTKASDVSNQLPAIFWYNRDTDNSDFHDLLYVLNFKDQQPLGLWHLYGKVETLFWRNKSEECLERFQILIYKVMIYNLACQNAFLMKNITHSRIDLFIQIYSPIMKKGSCTFSLDESAPA